MFSFEEAVTVLETDGCELNFFLEDFQGGPLLEDLGLEISNDLRKAFRDFKKNPEGALAQYAGIVDFSPGGLKKWLSDKKSLMEDQLDDLSPEELKQYEAQAKREGSRLWKFLVGFAKVLVRTIDLVTWLPRKLLMMMGKGLGGMAGNISGLIIYAGILTVGVLLTKSGVVAGGLAIIMFLVTIILINGLFMEISEWQEKRGEEID